jgi:hypothetical protein
MTGTSGTTDLSGMVYGSVRITKDCTGAAYKHYGILCIDSDDGKMYKWNGTSMEEVGLADSDLTVIAALAPANGKIIIGNSTPAWSLSAFTLAAPGTAGNILLSDGTNWTSSSTFNISILNLPSTTASPGTTAGQIKHDTNSAIGSSGGDVVWYDGSAVRTFFDTKSTYLSIANNSGGRSPTASAYEIYADAGIWKLNTNGIETSMAVPTEVDASTAASPTAIQLSSINNNTITNYGQAAADINVTLPAAAANLSFLATVGTAQAANYWRFTSAAGGDMYLDGSSTGKNYVQFSAPAVGNYFSCFTFKTGAATWSWVCASGVGVLSTN